MLAVPAIYAPRAAVPLLGVGARLLAVGVALACLAVMITAAILQPNPDGVGTHTSLGLARCQFLYRTGMPCPSCGMTTSFAHFAHGDVRASFYVQPLGALLALLAAASFWVALYIAITGRPALRLLRLIPMHYYILPFMFFAIGAWGWKILIHLRGAG
jgi:hypothetical protein